MTNQNNTSADKRGPDTDLEESFPSDAFLGKYFGPDMSVTSPPAYGGRTQTLFNHLREHFYFALIYAPYILIREDDRVAHGVSTKYAFQNGRLSHQAKISLVGSIDYNPAAGTAEILERELFAEMKAQFELGRLRNIDSWWEWFVTEDAIGIRLTPEANPEGGNRPRRTLKEILGETD